MESYYLTPRWNVRYRLNGGVRLLVEKLRSAKSKALVAKLKVLLHLLDDVDSSLEFALLNAHNSLVSLFMNFDEEVLDLAGECSTKCVIHLPRGWGFPYKAMANADLPLAPDSFTYPRFSICPTTHDQYFSWSRVSPERSLFDFESFNVLMRTIPSFVHRMRDQRDVGQVLWPAAIPMARWAFVHRQFLSGKKILEIGAGMGLVGIVAGVTALANELESSINSASSDTFVPTTEVVLTDFNPLVLDNLSYCTKLNDPTLHLHQLDRLHPLGTNNHTNQGFGELQGEAEVDYLCRKVHVEDIPMDNIDSSVLFPSSDAFLHALGEQLPSNYDLFRVMHLDWDMVFAQEDSSDTLESEAHVCTQKLSTPRSDSSSESDELGTNSNHASITSAKMTFDVIIGSDMICRGPDAFGTAAVVNKYLSENGVAFFFLPPAHVRYGIDHVEKAMAHFGLYHTQELIPTEFLTSEYDEKNRRDPSAIALLEYLDSKEKTTPIGSDDDPRNRVWDATARDVTIASGYEGYTRVHVVKKRPFLSI